jgi:hypothetical protein
MKMAEHLQENDLINVLLEAYLARMRQIVNISVLYMSPLNSLKTNFMA